MILIKAMLETYNLKELTKPLNEICMFVELSYGQAISGKRLSNSQLFLKILQATLLNPD